MASLKFHPITENLLAVAEWSGSGNGGLILWDVKQMNSHEYSTDIGVLDVDFRPQDNTIAGIQTDGQTMLWNMESGAVIQQIATDAHTRLRFHPNGKWLVSFDPDFAVWDLTTGEIVMTQYFTQSIEFLDDGKSIFLAGGMPQIGLFDIETGSIQEENNDHYYAYGIPRFWHITADGQLIIAAEDDEYERQIGHLDF